MAPRFSQSQIAFVNIEQLSSKAEYKQGYQYFLKKYAVQLGSNSYVEQIGSIVIQNTVFYVLFIRNQNVLYQALYSLKGDGTIKFDQLSPL